MIEEKLNEAHGKEVAESYIISLINEYQEHLYFTKKITRSSYGSFYNSICNLRKAILHPQFINSFKNSIIKIKQVKIDSFNPYPIIIKEIQNCCLRKTDNIIIFENIPEPTNIVHLYKLYFMSSERKNDESIFGLYPIMRVSDPCALYTPRNLANILHSLSTRSFQLASSTESLTVQSILSLAGRSISIGGIYPYVESYDFRMDFFFHILLTQIQNAVDSFYDAINYHLNFVVKSNGAIILDITIPNISSEKNKVVFDNYLVLSHSDWNNENIAVRNQVNRLAYIHVIEGQSVPFIIVELLLNNNCTVNHIPVNKYEKVRIQYTINALQYKEIKQQKEIWSFFGNNESNFLHNMLESVFFDQASAEVYMTHLLKKTTHLADSDLTGSSQSGSINNNVISAISNKGIPSTNLIFEEKPKIFEKFKFSNDLIMKETNTRQKVLQNLDFKDESLWKKSLESAENHWIEKVARSRKIIDFFMILENVLKLVQFESALVPEEFNFEVVKQEIILILNSPAYKLYTLTQQNLTLRQVMYSFHEHCRNDVVAFMFKNFIASLQSSLEDLRLKNFVSFNKIVIKKLEKRIKKFLSKKPELISSEVMLELRYYNSVSSYLLWQIVQDILSSCCQQLSSLINEIRVKYSQNSKDEVLLLKSFEFANDVFLFTMKSDSSTQNALAETHNRDVLDLLTKENFGVYWKLFVNKFMSINSFNPTFNPINILAKYLHLASIRYDLKSISVTNLQGKLATVNLELINSEFNLYKLKDVEIFGSKLSLSLFAGLSSKNLLKLVKIFDCGLYETKKDMLQAFISTGIYGQLSFYGQIYPNIRMIELIDYVYITAPHGCITEACQFFAQLVIQNLLKIDLNPSTSNLVCQGIFAEESKKRWSIMEIKKNPRESLIQIGKCAELSNTICAKFYVKHEWRYLPLLKHFRFHFIEINKPQLHNVAYKDIANLERFQLLFFTEESANGFYQINSLESSERKIYEANEKIDKISYECCRSQKWTKYFEAILTKSLINEDLKSMEEMAKIFYSFFGQLSYLNIVNKTIQHLLFSVMETNSFSLISNELNKTAKSKRPDLTAVTNSFRCYYYVITKLFDNESLRHIYMLEEILSILNEICFMDTKSQQIDIIPSSENIQKMEQLRQILENIEDIYGYGCWRDWSIYQSYSKVTK